MISLDFKTQPELSAQLVQRVRDIRKTHGLSQVRLAEKSGVSLGSLKRFEQAGEVSLTSFIKICMALGRGGDIDRLLSAKEYASIQEVIADAKRDS